MQKRADKRRREAKKGSNEDTAYCAPQFDWIKPFCMDVFTKTMSNLTRQRINP